jgi:3'-phosphoadenosine 5'-phosphosulfate sulfotransferase (PAPS reductase)/FAD synthetase
VSTIAASQAILDKAYIEHNPVAIFLMFSGGHDSLTATHVGATWANERRIPFKVAHINTGIGIEQTREFVRETCSEHEWPLVELHADREEQTYEYIVRRYGKPTNRSFTGGSKSGVSNGSCARRRLTAHAQRECCW